MNPLGYFVMVVWVPIVLYLFSRLPVQRALIVSFLAGWLFLPEASIPLAGIPDINKVSLTCYGILIATALFDFQRFREFRMHWVDAPMLVWCLCPAVSSLTNGLGPYDGFASALAQTVTWGFPYFLGRLYLGSFRGLQQLAIAIVLGGLIYIPLCLFEIRMSPQLHFWLYGFYPQSFDQAIRYGGFRPIVFMQHGLMVGVWMMTATLLAFGFWRIGALAGLLQQFVQGIGDRSQRTTGQTVAPEGLVGPSLGIFLGLLATFVLVKSTGAYFLLALGIVLFLTMRWSRTALPLLLIVGVMCAYLGFASGGGMTPQAMEQISATATQLTTADRAASLTFRLKNEALLSAKARQQLWFGWGGWGRARIRNDYGQDISVTDSLWIITFGNYGVLGLASWVAALLVPVLGFVLFRYPVETWQYPQVVPAAVLAIGLILYIIDCLVNGMVNPIYTLVAGGIGGLVARPQAQTAQASRRNQSPSGVRRSLRHQRR